MGYLTDLCVEWPRFRFLFAIAPLKIGFDVITRIMIFKGQPIRDSTEKNPEKLGTMYCIQY